MIFNLFLQAGLSALIKLKNNGFVDSALPPQTRLLSSLPTNSHQSNPETWAEQKRDYESQLAQYKVSPAQSDLDAS